MCGRLWRESPREARLGIVSAAKVGCARARLRYWGVSGGCGWPLSLLSVAGVTHALWNKCAATGVTRVGRVVFARGELTCCSRACMLGVNCRMRLHGWARDEIGGGVWWVGRVLGRGVAG